MTCQACLSEVDDATLTLTAEGQWLCPPCYGQYQAMAATARIRRNTVHRRCFCGDRLVGTDEEALAQVTGQPHERERGFAYDVFTCSGCGATLRMLKDVHLVIGVILMVLLPLLAWFRPSGVRFRTLFPDVFIGSLINDVFIAMFLGYHLVKRRQFPRIRSHDAAL